MNRSRGITLRETKEVKGNNAKKEIESPELGLETLPHLVSCFRNEISEAAAFSSRRDTCGFD